MLTGLLPDNTQVWHNRNLFRQTRPDWITLPQLFKHHGYHSQSLGKVFSGNEKEFDPASWSVPEVLRVAGSKNYLLPENAGRGKQAPMEFADVSDEAYPDGRLAELASETLHGTEPIRKAFFSGGRFLQAPSAVHRAAKILGHAWRGKVYAADAVRPAGSPEHAYPDQLELAGYRNIPKDERVTASKPPNCAGHTMPV